MHWWALQQPNWGTEYRIGIFDSLAQSVRCQPPQFAVASIESALDLGLIESDDVPAIFRGVPAQLHYLIPMVESGAQSGQETVLRMLFRSAGLRYRSQVEFSGIGRVDFLVEECVVVEADSRRHHSDWAAQVRDRRRDLQLAARGVPSLRPAYQHIMYEQDLVLAGVQGAVAACRSDRPKLP